MVQVFNTHDQSINPSNPKIDQLDKLRIDLEKKKNSLTETAQIEMIDTALAKVDQARKEAEIGQKITNNQVRLGQYNQVKPALEADTIKKVHGVISDREADKIIEMKAVSGYALKEGQKFASMSGKEPSNISYMKANIKGLFDLVELKG